MDECEVYHAHMKPRIGVRSFCLFKISLFLLYLLGVPILTSWIAVRRSESRDARLENKFAQIRDMLLLYHEQHGAFPPTKYQPKANGPIHSWRVLLLPHTDVDYKQRFSKYDFSQAWNSASNLQAVGDMPLFYYFSVRDDNDITNYLAIGDGDEWPSQKPLKSRLVTSGKDRFLLVEYPDSEIHWMEPKY
jgi:hypothetical protein